MSGDLFRARLTGRSAVDPNDTVHPTVSGKTGLVEFYVLDTGVGAPSEVPEKGAARVILPNNVPCPLFAARYHFFDDFTFNPLVGAELALPDQPRVVVRRDVTGTAAGQETCCYQIVTHVLLAGQLQGKCDSAGVLIAPVEPVAPGEYGLVTCRDHYGNSQTNVVAMLVDNLGAVELAPETMVWLPSRIDITPPGEPIAGVAPDGSPHAWTMVPMGAEVPDHSHLRTGAGRHGGGPAFATFAPATVSEANALGYGL